MPRIFSLSWGLPSCRWPVLTMCLLSTPCQHCLLVLCLPLWPPGRSCPGKHIHNRTTLWPWARHSLLSELYVSLFTFPPLPLVCLLFFDVFHYIPYPLCCCLFLLSLEMFAIAYYSSYIYRMQYIEYSMYIFIESIEYPVDQMKIVQYTAEHPGRSAVSHNTMFLTFIYNVIN